MEDKLIIDIVTDPFCSWCWGSEPELRALETLLADSVELRIHMGYLVPDLREDEASYQVEAKGFAHANRVIAAYWDEPEAETAMPFDAARFDLFSEEDPAGLPANIAYKATELVGEPEQAAAYLRRLREGIFVEGRKVQRRDVQLEIAEEIGLNIAEFENTLDSGQAARAFQDDIALGDEHVVDVYPTYLLSYRSKQARLEGYILFQNLAATIEDLTDQHLRVHYLKRTEADLQNLLKRYPRLAVAEIRLLFNFESIEETLSWLRELETADLISLSAVGNSFWVTQKEAPMDNLNWPELKTQITDNISELIELSQLPEGDVILIGGSSSEVQGDQPGKNSSAEIGRVIIDEVLKETKSAGLELAVQCCEHLNRALVIEQALAQKLGLTPVNAVPSLNAGGSLAVAFWERAEAPCLVEQLKAGAGMDIGGVLIGMHLRPVVVPLRLKHRTIGQARITAGRSRLKYIGGPRAQYL